MRDEIKNNKLQLLGRLFSGLMHELRNPLSVIKLNLDLLPSEEEKIDIEEMSEIAKNSKEALSIIENLISRTMEFVRGNEDEFEICTVNSIVKTSFEFMKHQAKKLGIKFRIDVNNANDKILANRSQMIQVMMNLISNSFDAIAENPEVILKSYSQEGNVFFEIIDNGDGIKKENLDKIFDEFYTTKENGVGIGLFVTKKILDNHNASLSVESSEGVGTKFRIKLKNAKEQTI